MKARILLVEDNPATMEVMQQELEILGYEVAVARDGAEAVEMANSELPDLIIMDILMPKMDGGEATKQIRKNPKTQAIPVLAATAKALPEDRERCLESGCDGYIAKPFSYKELRDVIEKLLRK
ncbi:MAG: response regulator [Candidatus Binatia bacterium]